jgi:hypothetical protein
MPVIQMALLYGQCLQNYGMDDTYCFVNTRMIQKYADDRTNATARTNALNITQHLIPEGFLPQLTGEQLYWYSIRPPAHCCCKSHRLDS